ncbi:hypothetical protein GCM10028818_20970 [Spirosoma horti]
MDISIQLAGFLGPTLMILPLSEYLNFEIWRRIDPTVVSLNGLVLFVGGLFIVRCHNIWNLEWTLVITILGWLILTLGAYRMLFPAGRQLQKGGTTNVVLFILFFIGCFLTSKAYFDV